MIYGLGNFSFRIFSFGRPLIISRMEGFSSESWKKALSNFQDLNKFPPSFLTFFRRGFYFIFSYIRKSFNHFYFFPLNHFLLSLLTFFLNWIISILFFFSIRFWHICLLFSGLCCNNFLLSLLELCIHSAVPKTWGCIIHIVFFWFYKVPNGSS